MAINQPGNQQRNQQPMPDGSGGSAQLCVCLISCFLFLLVLTGGIFLGLFIFLPASPDYSWLLLAGMVLVSTPWFFWIMTCMYRCISGRAVYSIGGGKDRSAAPPKKAERQATIVPTAAPLAIVVEENTELPDGVEPQTGPSGIANGSPSDSGGSSSTSRESEKPLNLSMPS